MGCERGSVALLGIIMIMLLGSLGATLLTLGKTDLQIATNHRDGIAAQYLAEAGIQEAVAKLKTDPSFVNLTEKSNHVITSTSLGTLPTVGSYTVQIGPKSGAATQNMRLITAVGMVNKAQRQVVGIITLPSSEHSLLIVIWN